MTPARLLLTEDDGPLADALARLLRQEGYDVREATTATEALELVRRDPPDLVVLDVGLPDISGVEACRQLRRFWSGPVVMLTGRRHDIDEIVGLDAGADDYLTKPVNPHRLLARIRAALRRSVQPQIGPPIRGAVTCGDLVIDPDARTVTVDGRPLELTAREFDLLHLLVERAGHVLTRRQLLDLVWGPGYEGDTHVLDVYVSTLRKKLEASPNPDAARALLTVRGVGYRYDAAGT